MSRPSFSIYTLSLGKHIDLSLRLKTAAEVGFTHIELDTDDWYAYAESYRRAQGLDIQEDHHTFAAHALATQLSVLGLKVLCIQPFRHFEGLLDADAREHRIAEALGLFRAMVILETDLFMIPSSFLAAHLISPDRDTIAFDLRTLADLAYSVSPKLRVGYEALAWGTYINTWQQAWDVVQRVGRSNFGLVLDSFNFLGRVYADPTHPSGVLATASSELRLSLAELVATVPPSRIFLLQIADGARVSPSFDKTAPLPLLAWSRTSRLFPGEHNRGAYLPVVAFMEAVVGRLGFTGTWSLEYFNADLDRRSDPAGVARELAQRGMSSLLWLHEMLNKSGKSPASVRSAPSDMLRGTVVAL
ncbi:xylose isomerase-like protein [Mycena vitilis]|nr:xylose isomerase-like protein [Mycena vitilis]